MGKARHRAGNIVPMYQGDQVNYGGKMKLKVSTIVYKTNNKQQEGCVSG